MGIGQAIRPEGLKAWDGSTGDKEGVEPPPELGEWAPTYPGCQGQRSCDSAFVGRIKVENVP